MKYKNVCVILYNKFCVFVGEGVGAERKKLDLFEEFRGYMYNNLFSGLYYSERLSFVVLRMMILLN